MSQEVQEKSFEAALQIPEPEPVVKALEDGAMYDARFWLDNGVVSAVNKNFRKDLNFLVW